MTCTPPAFVAGLAQYVSLSPESSRKLAALAVRSCDSTFHQRVGASCLQAVYCVEHPGRVLGLCTVAVVVCSLGLVRFSIETDPQTLWVRPGSQAAEEKADYDVSLPALRIECCTEGCHCSRAPLPSPAYCFACMALCPTRGWAWGAPIVPPLHSCQPCPLDDRYLRCLLEQHSTLAPAVYRLPLAHSTEWSSSC